MGVADSGVNPSRAGFDQAVVAMGVVLRRSRVENSDIV